MNRRKFFLSGGMLMLLCAGISSCQKQTDLTAGTTSLSGGAKAASLTVGLPPVILWWAFGPAIPYSVDEPVGSVVYCQEAIGFTIHGKGYLCGGALQGTQIDANISDLWEFDSSTRAWTKKTSIPIVPNGGTAFVMGDNAYVVVGSETWQYNQPTDTWTQKASIPFGRYWATSFTVNGKGYVGLGYYNDNNTVPFLSDWWQYDPATDQWSARTSFPGGKRAGAPGFALGGKGYVLCGENNNGGYPKTVWQYNPGADSWTQKADFPGTGRRLAISAIGTIGGTAVGLVQCGDYKGGDLVDGWEYSQANDSWGLLPNMPAGSYVEPGGFVLGRSLFVANVSVAVLSWSK